MRSQRRYLLLAAVVVAVLAGAIALLRRASAIVADATPAGRPPAIHPDYVDTVIPPNIAPLNFLVLEPAARYYVKIHGPRGTAIEIAGTDPEIEIPPGPWRDLLEANRGREISIDVYVDHGDGRWDRFDTIHNRVAPDAIDPYLVYRRVTLASNYKKMGIYQRHLETFDESPILLNHAFGEGCVNCHTFANNRPDPMILHVRESKLGPNRTPTLLVHDGRVRNINTRTRAGTRAAGIVTWHPDGHLIAFSTNLFKLLTHSAGCLREVFDYDPDLGVYSVDANTVRVPPAIARPDRYETFPAWSHDGRYLYYCSAPNLPLERYREVRCDLMRIGYDAKTGAWGEPETVLSASETGMSINEPRPSPDGRFLLFCMADHGCFPPYEGTSDLYLMDLDTGQHRRLECNSDRAESWHAWSSNSRWIVFSSKRLDGLYARPYLSFIDDAGRAHKPVLLPQSDPAFYDALLETFNLPELITGPVQVSARELVRAIESPEDLVQAQAAAVAPSAVAPGEARPGPSRSRPEPGDEYH